MLPMDSEEDSGAAARGEGGAGAATPPRHSAEGGGGRGRASSGEAPRSPPPLRPSLSSASSSPAKTIAAAAAIARASGGSFGYREGASAAVLVPDPPRSPALYKRSKSDVGPSVRRGSGAADKLPAGGAPPATRGLLGAVRKGLGRIARGLKRLPSPKRQFSRQASRGSSPKPPGGYRASAS